MTLHNFIVENLILIKGKIKRNGKELKLKYNGVGLSFIRTEWAAYPLNEIFFKEVYSNLNVNERNVVDIGASIADSAIYFALKGAIHVYGYEPDKERYAMAQQNIRANHMEEKITIYERAFDGSIPENPVLKIDCEGCEYQLLNQKLDFRKFNEIILEYHKGFDEIKKKLSELNFNVEVKEESKVLGLLYAKQN